MIDYDETGFQRVTSKRKRRQQAEPMALFKRLERDFLDLQRDDWLGRVTRLVKNAHTDAGHELPYGKILCLGIGQPGEFKPARTQLAGLIALAEQLNVARGDVSLFEPALSDEDFEQIKALGLGTVSRRKLQHMIPPTGPPTLLYFPHCDREVIEAFLGYNWERMRLENFVLLGNHLQDYSDILPDWKFKQESPCVFAMSKRFTAWTVPQLANVPAAFNNVSIQFLSRSPQTSTARGLTAGRLTPSEHDSPPSPSNISQEQNKVTSGATSKAVLPVASAPVGPGSLRANDSQHAKISKTTESDLSEGSAATGASTQHKASSWTSASTKRPHRPPVAASAAALAEVSSLPMALPPDSDTEFWALPWSTSGRYVAPVEVDSDVDRTAQSESAGSAIQHAT